jgi:hypothetical protein
MVNENFCKLTVGHGSTKFFRRVEILRKIFCEHAYSEREAQRLSSVEDVTAASAVQTWPRVLRCSAIDFLDGAGEGKKREA